METIILFAPLVGALICGFGWKLIGETTGQWITTGLLFLAALLSWVVFFRFDGVTEHIQILRWIESGSLSTDWAIRMDRLTALDGVRIPGARRHQNRHDKGPRRINATLIETIKALK